MGTTTFYFEINNKKVEFTHVPKCGGTSAKIMLLEAAGIDWQSTPAVDWGVSRDQKKYTQRELDIWRNGYQKKIWDGAPDYKIAFIRDPVERLKSAYTNRILFHKKMNPISWEQFITTFPRFNNGDVMHHTRSITYWLGENPAKFTHIFIPTQMGDLSKLLHEISGKNIQPMRKQTGGHDLKQKINITAEQIKKIKNVYADDYKYWWNEKVVPQAFK